MQATTTEKSDVGLQNFRMQKTFVLITKKSFAQTIDILWHFVFIFCFSWNVNLYDVPWREVVKYPKGQIYLTKNAVARNDDIFCAILT